jgi:hypothetical protein
MNEITQIDYALAANRHFWLQHPIIGSPSWDKIERERNNPIYIGKPPFEWPVNGFLFRDPPTGVWYAYIGLYPKNYWPAGGCLLLKEESIGKWKEIGVVLEGNPDMFDGDGSKTGGMPDVSLVYEKGKYHMIYDWSDPMNKKGGIAYAWANSPEGPFHRDSHPIHLDLKQPILLDRYQRIYAATLIRRKRDWLILAMMSTPRNAGGTWALVGLTSENPEGPYCEPMIILSPQSNQFHPPLAEFFPAFEYQDIIYVPATSVAKNRTFQTLFCVAKEDALIPERWNIAQYGGIWHDRPDVDYEQGIWGQTFSGQIYKDSNEKTKLRILSFTKTRNNVGNALISECDWPYQFNDSFQLASPYTTASAILLPNYSEFELNMELKCTGSWALCWGCTNPIGPNRNTADCETHALMMRNRIQLEFFDNSIVWIIYKINGKKKIIASMKYIPIKKEFFKIKLTQTLNYFTLKIQDQAFGPYNLDAKLGRIELLPQINTVIEVFKFQINSQPKVQPIIYLASEAITGAACKSTDWKKTYHSLFKYKEGYISDKNSARAKWNVIGSEFSIISPKHPKLGKATLIVDGNKITELNFYTTKAQKSTEIYTFSAPYGKHAIILEKKEGIIVIDCLACQ